MKRIYFAILSVAVVLTSCSKDESGLSAGDAAQMISIDPMIQTRATELNFESGDQIGLSVVMNDDSSVYFANQMLEYNGTNFAASNLFWYTDALTSTLTAYYPYVAGDALPTSFTVQADQTTAAAYTASDLMVASVSDATPSSSATNMIFYHKLSRIVVDATAVSGVESVVIDGLYPTATLDLEAGSVDVDESGSTVAITAPVWSDGKHKAIVVPQGAVLTISVTFEDGTVESVETSYVYFAEGKEYTATLSFSGTELSITVSGDINSWEDGGSIGESASFEEFDTYFVYDGESYNFTTIGDVTIMTENLRYIPSGMSVSSDATDGSGLWYSCTLTTDDAGTVTAAANTTDSSKGYLYNFSTAMCGEEFTADNYDQFDGSQGICPKGWHIPSYDEWFGLSGQALSVSDDKTAPFYNADGDAYGSSYSSVITANEVGFNFTFAGAVVSSKYNTTTVKESYTSTTATPAEKSVGDASFVGMPGINYYMVSTGKSTTTLWTMMSGFAYNNVDGKFYLLSTGTTTGQAVRCVRDSVK